MRWKVLISSSHMQSRADLLPIVEPLPTDSPLRQMTNVILTPHNAYNTIEAENYVHDNTIKNLIEGLKLIKTTA